MLIEHYDAPGTSGYVPPFCAIRTPVFLYVRYDADRESRRQELYDMRVDPHQLVNRAKDPAYGTSLTNPRKRLRPMCVPTPPDYAF